MIGKWPECAGWDGDIFYGLVVVHLRVFRLQMPTGKVEMRSIAVPQTLKSPFPAWCGDQQSGRREFGG